MKTLFLQRKKNQTCEENHQKKRIIASGNLRRPSWEILNPNSSYGFQEKEVDSKLWKEETATYAKEQNKNQSRTSYFQDWNEREKYEERFTMEGFKGEGLGLGGKREYIGFLLTIMPLVFLVKPNYSLGCQCSYGPWFLPFRSPFYYGVFLPTPPSISSATSKNL